MRRLELIDAVIGWTSAPADIRDQILRGHCESVVAAAHWTNVLATCVIAAFIWDHVNAALLVGWVAAFAVAGYLMRAHVKTVERALQDGADPTREALKVLGVELLYGTIIAGGALVLYADATPFGRGVLLFYVWAASVVRIYTYVPGIYYARTVPAVLFALTATSVYGNVALFGVTAVFCLFAVLRGDLTRRVHASILKQLRLQEDLRQQSVALREANEVKDRFLMTMSHELRTPLNGVIGMAELLQSELTGRKRKRAEIIERSGRALLNLLNDILEFVRVPKRDESFSRAPFDLRLLLDEIVQLLDSRPEDEPRRLNLHLAPDVPRWLSGDDKALRRILFNLGSNAVKYGGGAPVEISVETLGEAKGRREIQLRFGVCDGGPGIAAEDQERVFNEFVRLEDATTGAQSGTGIGLAICRQLAEGMGGEITLESAPGAGARFYVTLPFGLAEPPSTTEQAAATEVPESLSVLLVEDDETNRKVVIEFLNLLGHRVAVAETGEEAVRRVASEVFDAIMMDIRLPGIDGVEATKRIRNLPDNARATVPIVAVTASVFPEERKRYLDSGMDEVVAKPIDFAHLEAFLARAAGAGA